MSQKVLAERVNKPQSVISDWENGKLDSWVDQIEDIAGAFGVMPDDLVGDIGVGENVVPFIQPKTPDSGFAHGPSGELAVVREARAGAWLSIDEFQQSEPELSGLTRDPRYPNARQWVSRVRGDSMNKLRIMDGDLVLCVDVDDARYQVNTGDVVEVERSRFQGAELEYSIKQVEVTSKGILLWPRSTNSLWTKPLEILEGRTSEDMIVTIRGLCLKFVMAPPNRYLV